MISPGLFQKKVWGYYRLHKRALPWRNTHHPYRVWVSEIMLQQTQVNRVIPKYHLFLKRFPTVQRLACAPLRDVLAEWSGLGYNRRAKMLHESAKAVVDNGFPQTREAWAELPGIGLNTAGAIMAYAHNAPVAFIETNIRSVYIHEFFKNQANVLDKDVLAAVQATVDKENPREWYWALMDYGTMLKQTIGNTSRASRHYVKQSKFIGSNRQLRGKIIKLLIQSERSLRELAHETAAQKKGLQVILDELQKEKLVKKVGQRFRIA